MSLLLNLNIFILCFSVSIVVFEHIIAGWVCLNISAYLTFTCTILETKSHKEKNDYEISTENAKKSTIKLLLETGIHGDVI